MDSVSVVACDDGFSEFVQGRTSQLNNEKIQCIRNNSYKNDFCEIEKPDRPESVLEKCDNMSPNVVNELLRSEGSGSENGMDASKDDLIWYRNEKHYKDKSYSPIPSIHQSKGHTRDSPGLDLTGAAHQRKWTSKYAPVNEWQSQRMESFESNKEYVGSECGSPLSCYSPGRKPGATYSGCASPGPGGGVLSPSFGEWEDDSELGERPTGERWPPLGAPNDEEDNHSICSFEELGRSRSEVGRLKELEEEQEQLNTSLMSLTTHFAQVQFRLKQIVLAEPGEKERLLRELEEFADRGIPDVRAIQQTRDALEKRTSNLALSEQRELIDRLKQQLDELEQYAYSAGEAGPPQAVLVQKQKLVIDQLMGKLPLDIEDIGQLSVEDLRQQVDVCVKQLVNPLKMKEQLVTQLQTQIGDLERFIDFLQDDGLKKLPPGALSPSKCGCGGHSTGSQCTSAASGGSCNNKARTASAADQKKMAGGVPLDGREGGKGAAARDKPRTLDQDKKKLRDDTAQLVNRASLLLNMIRFAQLGCGSSSRDTPSSTAPPKGSPAWGELRANLELAIATLGEQLSASISSTTEYTSDSDGSPSAGLDRQGVRTPEVTLLVRKQLVPALRDLLHHGLSLTSSGRSLVLAWSCFPDRSASGQQLLHAWDLVLRYYRLKHGDHYNTRPARRLSQSFNLEMSNGSSLSGGGGVHKGALLAAVGNILATHTPLKRSPDSHFKAFVSEALNQQRLVVWLRLILRCKELINECYQSWSYVQQTGFDDAFKSLETLQQYQFCLPVDLAVRSLRNITDAF